MLRFLTSKQYATHLLCSLQISLRAAKWGSGSVRSYVISELAVRRLAL